MIHQLKINFNPRPTPRRHLELSGLSTDFVIIAIESSPLSSTRAFSLLLFLHLHRDKHSRRHADIDTGRPLDGHGPDGLSGYAACLNLTECSFDVANDN